MDLGLCPGSSVEWMIAEHGIPILIVLVPVGFKQSGSKPGKRLKPGSHIYGMTKNVVVIPENLAPV